MLMKLIYDRPHKLSKLHAELLQLSFLQPIVRADEEREAILLLQGNGQTVYLDVPDDLTPEQIAEIERVINNHYPDLTATASPNPATVNETVVVTATLPDGAPDTEVIFQVEGGTAYTEPITNGQASHAYAFAQAGTYRIIVSSVNCGTATVEVMVQ
ncbi:PKD domain [Moorella glycerini]|uniref:PKD domain-containing protein n=1 Tax=Neomoorella stamsii TaxID=1266720 RepID=A0A9X7J0E2_9FIRM|nr:MULTISPECIES: Ig-like domain-containing protein [Moorella]PRR69578.1 hypothetical protein MOST_30000 [Moorella stamsii]CEP67898.1 PKD domain [Moorella glycerini]CEP68768.1 PKD domain [Moorella glycerini]